MFRQVSMNPTDGRRARNAAGLLLPLLFLVSLLAGALPTLAVDVNSQEMAIFNYMRTSSGQRRPFLVLDPVLCKVARQKAADMAARHYYAHVDPSGHGANYLVRAAGYVLPADYDMSPSANNIESLSAGRDTASWAWSDWMSSAPHKQHLLGEAAFYAAQTSVGVGFVNVPGSEWQWYWVVMTAPPSGPQLFVASPAPSTRTTSSSITVSGSTGGEPAAATVQVRAETASAQGDWVTATGTTAWSATIDNLTPGPNTLRIRTLSSGGDVLRETTRGIRYVVLAPVTVDLSGSGTVSPGFAGTTMREVGVTYTITATPKSGNLFSGWSGAITGLQRTTTFVPEIGGITLKASFIPNPFLVGTGSYSTLFAAGTGSPGQLNLALASTGVFTGTLRLNGEVIAVKGRFDAQGAGQVTVKSKTGAIYNLDLTYSNATGVGAITGAVSGEGWSADVSFDALSKPGTTPSVDAGRYTLVLPTTDNVGVPSGDGAATVTVSAAGLATISGSLADGRTFSGRSRVTTDHQVFIYTLPYTGTGLLAGALHFREQTSSDIDGTLHWERPVQQTAPRFSTGFVADMNAVGSRYVAPKPGELVVPAPVSSNNTSLALGDGGFSAPVVQPATLSAANTLVISAPEVKGLTATLNPVNGVFSGRFVHPVTGEAATFRGVILQKQGAGFGFFAGGSKAGYATFTAVGQQAAIVTP